MRQQSVDVAHWLPVSRETIGQLRHLEALVQKWNPKINLVSKSSLEHLWDRHIIDSAQLYQNIPANAGMWCDLGSGGGFPGLVIAAVSKELSPDLKVVLVESDRRKAAFLVAAARDLGVKVEVKVGRIEELDPLGADVLSARALAPLADLCRFAHRHLAKEGAAIFPKGAGSTEEISVARRIWRFQIEQRPSVTSPDGTVLILREIEHV